MALAVWSFVAFAALVGAVEGFGGEEKPTGMVCQWPPCTELMDEAHCTLVLESEVKEPVPHNCPGSKKKEPQ